MAIDAARKSQVLTAAARSQRLPVFTDACQPPETLRLIEQLRAAARAFSRELDTFQLARVVTGFVLDIVGGEQAFVYLSRENELRVVAAQDCRNGCIDFPKSHAPASSPLRQWVTQHRQAQLGGIVGGGRVETGVAEASSSIAACAPILNHQGHVVGLIEVQYPRRRGVFTQQDLNVLQCLADHAATGFDRSQLFDRMQEWTGALETLLTFNAAVNQHLSPTELVRRLVQHAVQFLKASGGLAGLVVPAADPTGFVLSSDGYYFGDQWIDRSRSWRLLDGMPGTVLASEFPCVVNNYLDDILADADFIDRFGVRKALCVPIKSASDSVIGFFELHRDATSNDFTWQDAAFLESLGNTAAVGIENAQLLKSLEVEQQRILALSAANVTRWEEERQHIARELHDETGQMLVGLNLGLQFLARLIPNDLIEAQQQLVRLRRNVRQSAVQLKALARRLRPPTLDQLGFVSAIRQLAAEFQQHMGAEVYVQVNSTVDHLPDPIGTALYRIAQEALTNAHRHAKARNTWLRVAAKGHSMTFVIQDDGVGFDPNRTEPGLGLLGMRERVEMLGGSILIRSSHGQGTTISIEVPLHEQMPIA